MNKLRSNESLNDSSQIFFYKLVGTAMRRVPSHNVCGTIEKYLEYLKEWLYKLCVFIQNSWTVQETYE